MGCKFEQGTLGENNQNKVDTHGYDMVGNAQMTPVLQVRMLSLNETEERNDCKITLVL